MADGAGTIGVILAGGRSSRMGGNEKAFLALADRPMIQVALDRLKKQTDTVIINANGDPERMAFLGVPVQKDVFGGFAGPLAGVHAGMQWVRHNQPQVSHICTIAADTPFFPADLTAKLEDSRKTTDTIVLAASNGYRHPVFGLWPVSLIEDLTAFLQSGQTGKVMAFVKQHAWTEAEFENLSADGNSIDPFFNVNTPEELELARQLQEQISIDE